LLELLGGVALIKRRCRVVEARVLNNIVVIVSTSTTDIASTQLGNHQVVMLLQLAAFERAVR